jgi:hypothetical protein
MTLWLVQADTAKRQTTATARQKEGLNIDFRIGLLGLSR